MEMIWYQPAHFIPDLPDFSSKEMEFNMNIFKAFVENPPSKPFLFSKQTSVTTQNWLLLVKFDRFFYDPLSEMKEFMIILVSIVALIFPCNVVKTVYFLKIGTFC